MINAILLILIGAISVVVYQTSAMLVRQRLNYGKKIYVNRRKAGNLISCRYNGVKYYFYINEYYEPSKVHYANKQDAIEACQEEFSSSRPKQTLFAKAS